MTIRKHRNRRLSPFEKLLKALGFKPGRGGRRKPLPPWVPIMATALVGIFAIPPAWGLVTSYFANPCETGNYKMVISGISDVTNKLPLSVQDDAEDVWLKKVPNMMGVGVAVRLSTLTGNREAPLRTGFKGCSAKRGHQAIVAYETGDKVNERWVELFGANWEENVKSMPKLEAAHTPLLQAIDNAYVDSMRLSGSVEEVIIPIVSDGLIHLPEVSAYRTSGSRSLHNPDVQARLIASAPDLQNAKIILFLVPPSHTDSRGVGLLSRQQKTVEFLERYFSAAGAEFTVRSL